MEPREFVTVSSSVNLQSVKEAREKHYNEEKGTCDVLHSDRGSSCVSDDQVIGKKVFLIRFLKNAS